MRHISHFDIAYAHGLRVLLDQPIEPNTRTKRRVKAAHGLLFQFGPDVIPLLTLRDIKPLWACAEAVWFVGGGTNSTFMKKFGFNVWDKFSREDGFVESATGFRWRSAFEVDQLKELISKLSEDPSNRQGILTSWDPKKDNLSPGKNVPCVDMWHFHILAKRLHMSVLQRSGDMYFGVPHDILGSRLVQELLAARLGVRPGAISYLVSNAHLYEDQWPAAEEMLARAEKMMLKAEKINVDHKDLNLTAEDFVRAAICDDVLPLELAKKVNAIYNPWPAITGPKLAL